ncbi:hypothetical protein MMAG44476_27228 [Mycolicibacterium mageritense DSM 44476 = CIP 104973]|jgi:hypothetical protein|nr:MULTISPECIES: hypothetical protein [Mycolicibacterium]MCC9179453.1 hypothetical protein [Mycolicibacterium mageritense]MCV7207124.1 hypothetical protein [Mycolicibacterium canariasense]ORU98625.1 hypothetical protein AWB94_28235 [Mycolicibacterium canariasense]
MSMIGNASRDTQLYVHTLASALACASKNEVPTLEPDNGREPSPAAQRSRVLSRLDAVLVDLDRVLRAKKIGPTGVPRATLGRRLASNGEVYDAVKRTYTPGPGFNALAAGLISEALVDAGNVTQNGALA